ncbi:MAG TPA: hypothetical protein VIK91_12470, partial [Nannocystis sp.]
MADTTIHEDDKLFLGTVEFSGGVTFGGQTAAEAGFSLDNLDNLGMTGDLAVGGHASVGGTLDVTGAATFADDVAAAKDLDVVGDASIGGTLDVTGALSSGAISAPSLTGSGGAGTDELVVLAAGGLSLEAAAGVAVTAAGGVSVTGDVAIDGNLSTTGDAAVGGGFTVAGETTLGAGQYVPRWYYSQEITTADLAGGSAAEFIALADLP